MEASKILQSVLLNISLSEHWLGIQELPLADLKEDNGSFGTFQKLKKIQA